jgi:hypothetical protein
VQDVTVKIRFLEPCLGADRMIREKLGVVFCFPRTAAGQVRFHQTWWRAIVTHAARLRHIPTSIIKQIEWTPEVEGSPRLWRRFIHDPTRAEHRRPGYAQHEAFLPGQVVGLECTLPAALTLADFRGLMEVAGRSRGISPYKPGAHGKFEVVSMQPHGRFAPQERDMLASGEPAGGPSDGLV